MNASKPTARRALRSRSLQGQLLRRLVLAALVPILLLGLAESALSYRTQRQVLTERTAVSAVLQAMAVEEFIQSHVSAVALLARTSTDASDWDTGLDVLRRQYPAIVTTLHADRAGVLHASSPTLERPSVSIADRAYFREPLRTGQAYVSDAFRGRGFGEDPLIAVSAPVWSEAGVAGIVEASIHVGTFTRLRSSTLRQRGLEMLILDRDNHVVHASAGLPFRFLQDLDDAPFARTPAVRGRPVVGHAAAVLRDGSDAFTARTGMAWGWSLVLFAPESALYDVLWQRIGTLLAMLTLAAAGMLLAVRLVMRRFTVSLEGFVAALQRLAQRREAALGATDVPTELEPLARSIDELNRRLDSAQQDNVELDRLNRLDPLTGVLNRRGIDDAFASLRAASAHRPVAVLAFDIDHFKRYNDRYGHLAGDAALRAVSAAVAAALRAGDVLGRTGGEEFIAMLPDANLEAAIAVAERARQAVVARCIDHADADAGCMTVSIGVHAATAAAGPDILIGHADRALYRAKHGGRNRVST